MPLQSKPPLAPVGETFSVQDFTSCVHVQCEVFPSPCRPAALTDGEWEEGGREVFPWQPTAANGAAKLAHSRGCRRCVSPVRPCLEQDVGVVAGGDKSDGRSGFQGVLRNPASEFTVQTPQLYLFYFILLFIYLPSSDFNS